MRLITLLCVLVPALAACGPQASPLAAPMAHGPVGFGAGTTGGNGGPVCSWTDEASLRGCVTGDQPKIARASGNPTVQITDRIEVGANTTLEGPATIEAANVRIWLEVRAKSNVIVQGVTFHGLLTGKCAAQDETTSPAIVKGCGLPINIIDASSLVWLDGDAFDACGEKCVEVWSLGPGHTPDRITVSGTRFTNSYFGMAVGVCASCVVPPPGSERVTIWRDTFDHIFRRSVRAASGAWVHEIDTKVSNWGAQTPGDCLDTRYGFGPSSTGGAQLLLENNTFVAGPACKEAVDDPDYVATNGGTERGRGFVHVAGSVVSNGARATANQPQAVFAAPYALSAH